MILRFIRALAIILVVCLILPPAATGDAVALFPQVRVVLTIERFLVLGSTRAVHLFPDHSIPVCAIYKRTESFSLGGMERNMGWG